MNQPATSISLEMLRKAFDLLVRHAAAQGSEGRIALHKDAFWSVPTASVNDIYSGPPDLTVGIVSESWGHLEAMIGDETKVVGYGLIWLADVLRALGSEVAW